MILVLNHCAKEWRAQRGLLGAYLLLVFACMAIGWSLLPDARWDEHTAAHVLAWFVAIAAIGVVVVAAPQLVRGELCAGDGRLAARLPGALPSSFGGKLLFLALASVAMPLLGLVAGELYLLVLGRDWIVWLAPLPGDRDPLWQSIRLAGATVLASILLAPLVWAVGLALPGGRMAFGGTALLVLGPALVVVWAVAGHPGLADSVASWHWLWPVWPLGVASATAAWILGRRGGGIRRSATLGGAVLAASVAPPGVWLAALVHEYHHPDLVRPGRFSLEMLSPDLRFAVARVSGRPGWDSVPVRIDLRTGVADRLGGVRSWTSDQMVRPYLLLETGRSTRRYVRIGGGTHSSTEVVNLITGARHAIDPAVAGDRIALTPDLRERLVADLRESTPFRRPDGHRVWIVGDRLHYETNDGEREIDWPFAPTTSLFPAGHGIAAFAPGTGAPWLFDLARMRPVSSSRSAEWFGGMQVGSHWLVRQRGTRPETWLGLDPESGAVDARPELDGVRLCVPLSADEVLAVRARDGLSSLLVHRPGDRRTTEIELPPEARPRGWQSRGSWTQRDARGRIWLRSGDGRTTYFLAFDPATRACETIEFPGDVGFLAFAEGTSFLALVDARAIARIDYESGECTVLYPRNGGPPRE